MFVIQKGKRQLAVLAYHFEHLSLFQSLHSNAQVILTAFGLYSLDFFARFHHFNSCAQTHPLS